MSASEAALPALTRQRPFVLFWFSRLAVTLAYHMLVVAIGWTIYELTNSALNLGLVGLIQFVPNVILTLLVGHAADRYDRRYIVIAAQVFYALAALTVLVVLVSPVKSVNLLFFAVLVLGCARASDDARRNSGEARLSRLPPGRRQDMDGHRRRRPPGR